MNTRADQAVANADAFQQALGVRSPAWFIGKARREQRRFETAEDDEHRNDALLNFAWSLIALEDWTQPGNVEASEWRRRHRAACAPYAVVALIALVAKHRLVRDGQLARLTLTAIDQIEVWTEDARMDDAWAMVQMQLPTARLMNVRNVLDDDQIAGRVLVFAINGLQVGPRGWPTQAVMQAAVDYWRALVPADG